MIKAMNTGKAFLLQPEHESITRGLHTAGPFAMKDFLIVRRSVCLKPQ